MLEGDPNESWRECKVIDISTAGAGLELLDSVAQELDGHRNILTVQLAGEIRNSGPGRHNGIRAGVQFADLSESERCYLDSIVELKAVW